MIKKSAQKILNGLGFRLMRLSKLARDPFLAQAEIIGRLNRSKLTIFDIGANRGQTALKYRAIFPNAEIYCFEPFPDSIRELRKRFVTDEQVHVVPSAVAQQIGVSVFYVNEFDPTNSLFPRPSAGRRYYPKSAGPKEKIEVETISLDAFVSDKGISKIDILKFDIQGGELNALRGAEQLLMKGDIPLIYTEIMFVPHYESAALFHEIWTFLSRFGYSPYDIYHLVRAKNGQLRYGDALFISDETRSSVVDSNDEEP